MNIIATTVSLTVEDVAAFRTFFTTHLGFLEVMVDQGVRLAQPGRLGQ
ncbi:hypothetical protein ACIBH1_48860 [Nonomuraea sp. NPDC050663]